MQSQAKHALSLLQGSPEWLAFKCGRIGSSQIADLTAKTKSGWGASRANLMGQLIAERLTGQAAGRLHQPRDAMGHGDRATGRARPMPSKSCTTSTASALSAIPRLIWRAVVPMGSSATMAWWKSSAPTPRRTSRRCSGAQSQPNTSARCNGSWVLRAGKWVDFVSFDPRMPDHMQLFCKRLTRDDTHIATLEKEVRRVSRRA